jgi:2-oxo-4-hydroxy-4-carboxy-5-ureidoimidazoline decarboxylase
LTDNNLKNGFQIIFMHSVAAASNSLFRQSTSDNSAPSDVAVAVFDPLPHEFMMSFRALLVVASSFVLFSQSFASLGTNMAATNGNSRTCSPAEACSADVATKLSVKELLVQPPDAIVSQLGGIYEHSPWVAETFVQQYSKKEISTVTELATHLKAIVDGSSREDKLTLLRAHPDLCEKVEKMKELTVESQQEQSRAGLQSMQGDELQKFKDMNASYKQKYGFPFILAVRNASKHTVLSALEGRLPHSVEQELVIAMEQVNKIAWMRLLSMLNTDDAQGFLTCHGECNSRKGEREGAETSTFIVLRRF